MIALVEHEEREKNREIPKVIECQVKYMSWSELILENIKFHLGNCGEMYKSICCSFEENDE